MGWTFRLNNNVDWTISFLGLVNQALGIPTSSLSLQGGVVDGAILIATGWLRPVIIHFAGAHDNLSCKELRVPLPHLCPTISPSAIHVYNRYTRI